MSNDNMKLWNAVCKTNPVHTKAANVRGNKITAIAPQSQIMAATEQFGAYGVHWGFKSIELDYSLVPTFKVVVFKGDFFCPSGGFQIISSCKMYMDKAEKMVDSDFAKKIETDALTKALSKLGFNADVFMGLYDDVKYIADMNAEFSEFIVDDTAQQWIDAVKANPLVIEQITDPTYKANIQREAAK